MLSRLHIPLRLPLFGAAKRLTWKFPKSFRIKRIFDFGEAGKFELRVVNRVLPHKRLHHTTSLTSLAFSLPT